MAYYYIQSESKVVQLDAALYAQWVANGNPKASYYTPIPDPPGPGYTYDGTQWVAPPVYIPQQVTAFQARAALYNANLLATVEAAVTASTEETLKLAWNHALHFERNSPTIAAMAAALGLTSQQVDDLFLAASVITA